jgi:hypothetical protein
MEILLYHCVLRQKKKEVFDLMCHLEALKGNGKNKKNKEKCFIQVIENFNNPGVQSF